MSKRNDAVASVKALLRGLKSDIDSLPNVVTAEAGSLAVTLDNLARAARGIRDLAEATVKTRFLDNDLSEDTEPADDNGPKPADNVSDKPHYYGKGCGQLDAIDMHNAELAENGNTGRNGSQWD